MIFRRNLCKVLFLLLASGGFAQTDSLKLHILTSSNIFLGLNGSVIYPGIRAGIELPVSKTEIRFQDPEIPDTISRDRFVAGTLGWYHHPDFHDNIYLTAEWRMRRTWNGGFFIEFSPGIGYSRTFLGGTTYEVDSNGDVRIKTLAGFNYGLITLGGGLGFDFESLKRIPLSVYSRFNILMMFPYNSTIYLRPAAEIGVIYRPTKFFAINVKRRIIRK